MAALSISRAWDETKAVLKSDGKLFVPLVLAFMVLPGVLVGLARPRLGSAEDGSGTALLIMVGVSLIALVGQLAVQWLTVRPGARVADSLRQGARATPWVFLAIMLLVIPLSIVAAPFAAPLVTGADEAAQARAALFILLILAVALIALVRFTTVGPAAVAERLGPVAMLRRSWTLTKGSTVKLYGLFILFLLVLLLVNWAAMASLGSVILLAFGQPEPWSVSALLLALVAQLAQVAVTLPMAVLLARIYAQLAGVGAVETSVPHAP
ncbi:hypothetical protein ACFQPG_05775 [Sphingomonas sp. GCM10030256]|uniref:hypothetical protein n=1 Tax=Sphingomonas sp. GCM10030256 TaxID=3273427 RepID=UPI003623DE88